MAKLVFFLIFWGKKILNTQCGFQSIKIWRFHLEWKFNSSLRLALMKQNSICQKLSKRSNLAYLLSWLKFICNFIYQSNCWFFIITTAAYITLLYWFNFLSLHSVHWAHFLKHISKHASFFKKSQSEKKRPKKGFLIFLLLCWTVRHLNLEYQTIKE